MSNDLKIMTKTCVVSYDKRLAYDIYSFNTNSWKRLEPPLLLGCLGVIQHPVMDSCINGVYYWIARVIGSHLHPQLAQRHLYWVLSFNMSIELFKFSDLPQVDWDFLSAPSDTNYDIGLYKECLAIFVTRRFRPELVGSFYIWVATEFDDDFGVPLAWQRLFSSRLFPTLYDINVITARMNGDLLLLIDGDLCLYNPATDNISSFSISIECCHRYVVSLVPLLRRFVRS
ncbi:uncharacterized protein LOC110709237 [Chenopodium quinoa]|uniref:uncharacterized protein LOC110709237 n=1 Tax=Chenopodium quinoa TaxID=63459 RepID=UPI000B76FDE1|nr:uncharacterized protein LOC110709237 [Chenopodium quinoa]XP_021743140.1 uncharacterized protein LOC110709237 [Chenopodium quinoa]XP_021743141.1 uncharacterized protein LOC110709237 [Chenopodium quinoa]